ncbi:MAG: response regulator transcription factor [Deltaproteobacteria bacterium]|nr:response regulator transcription factor [Deltaproteobacteria bacterium]
MNQNLKVEEKPLLKILFIEDNPSDVQLVSRSLRDSRLAVFEVHHTTNLGEAASLLNHMEFDAIIVDLFLPDSSGLSTLEALLAKNLHLPILVLTGYQDEVLGIQAVRRGAEEYFIKGEIPEEYLARFVTLAIERFKGRANAATDSFVLNAPGNLNLGNLEIDLLKQVVSLKRNQENQVIPLTPIEFRILVLLSGNPGEVMSRSQIVTEIWNNDPKQVSFRTVDKHISSLKRKCSPALDHIQCVYGVGYCLNSFV